MQEKHNIETYSKLADGANFFLEESFRYVNEALIDESAELIFSDLIKNIHPTKEDIEISKIPLPEKAIDLLQAKDLNLLSDNTHWKIENEWLKAQEISRIQEKKFKYNHQINSIRLIGHINNLAFFIETLTNRHLLFLNQSHQLDDFSYSRFAKARIVEKLLFMFKDEISKGKFHLNEVVSLFNLRNKTVHYTPENVLALKPTISELLQIWKQCMELIENFERSQDFNEFKFSEVINDYVIEFKRRWS